MPTWSDDDGVTHATVESSLLTTACGLAYESSARPVVFHDENQVITCVWCALRRPRGFAENLVLVHNQKHYAKTKKPAGEKRGRAPTRRCR
jgi:hypothetical protein